MKSFWDTKPVQTTKMNLDIISENINQELTQYKRDSNSAVSYTIIQDCSGYSRALAFINKYYISTRVDSSGSSVPEIFQYYYSPSLFSWYVKNAIVLEFSKPLLNDEGSLVPIGYIVGRKTKVTIQNNVYDSMEVNFLCLHPILRHKFDGLCGYMVNTLTKVILSQYNEVQMAHYTISSIIRSPHYCEKVLYFAIMKKIKTCRILSSTDLSKYYVEHFTNTILEQWYLCRQLYNMYMKYAMETYRVCENMTFSEFEEIFSNEMFHHFVVRYNRPGAVGLVPDASGIMSEGKRPGDIEQDSDILAYICMYEVDIMHTSPNAVGFGNNNSPSVEFFKNGNYYLVAFTNTEDIPLYTELINKYIQEKCIFDMVSFLDLFETFHYDSMSFERCDDSKVRYYMYNMMSSNIHPWECGLITI